MAPKGWLDIHGHFTIPKSDEVAQKELELFHSVDFMVYEPWRWTPEGQLPYLDRANVQMQMLSYLPRTLSALKNANDYGAQIVANHSSRFGLLLALPTDDPEACLAEIKRGDAYPVPNDGYATITVYNNVSLSDERLESVWNELDARKAVVHVHPDANKKGTDGRPSPLIDVAFDTARTATDMLYKGVFRRWPNIKWVFGHCGGALPVLSGRLSLLGAESWVPNPLNLTREEIETTLGRLYVDTAATAKTGLAPAIKMVGVKNIVYGADCGVPCSTDATMDENQQDVLDTERSMFGEEGAGVIAGNGWNLFPAAAKRAEEGQKGK
ncbi:hypothetical protein K469DRAFT_691984 [Zopfia rhizophila CBS 207.26]|uniref:6-methylsalicylate decarboxylase n=1 Tax=Zopfia rhizophila CBS 207.26 TaxID=1314779 RepID=A0A6A6DV02_9PEZI|nr:hypothetical protein K469DRAFT_691984 [Zopfia rhizophila CBS 207.26]